MHTEFQNICSRLVDGIESYLAKASEGDGLAPREVKAEVDSLVDELRKQHPGFEFEVSHACASYSAKDFYGSVLRMLCAFAKHKMFGERFYPSGIYDVWTIEIDDYEGNRGATLRYIRPRRTTWNTGRTTRNG